MPVPGDHVVGVEPPLGLPPIAVVEDAHDASLDLQAVPARADVAQRAHVVVVGEDIVLAYGEPEWAQPREQLELSIATFRADRGRRTRGRPVRLTASASPHGLALALPEKVVMARPTGVGRALTAYRMPIEGRDEWLAAARRPA